MSKNSYNICYVIAQISVEINDFLGNIPFLTDNRFDICGAEMLGNI